MTITLGMTGCATAKNGVGFFSRMEQKKKLSSAVELIELGNVDEATRLLTEICDGNMIIPGITDEALFRLSLIYLRPGSEKESFSSAYNRLDRLQKEYPSSSWARISWPLMEFLESFDELRRTNKNLKNNNQTLTKENKELHQNVKDLNQIVKEQNQTVKEQNQTVKDLNQSIERLKHLDLELEHKTKPKI